MKNRSLRFQCLAAVTALLFALFSACYAEGVTGYKGEFIRVEDHALLDIPEAAAVNIYSLKWLQ